MPDDPISNLRVALRAAVEELAGTPGSEPDLERPKRSEQGDFSSNAAMALAPVLGESPRLIAERLGEGLRSRLGSDCEGIEVAGPGFLNLFMTDDWYRASVDAVLTRRGFGGGEPRSPSVQLEFVSANPTGPLTAAGGRGAVFGDSLARVLEFAGHEVEREYYMNDSGTQVRSFAASISARMRGEDVPEDGYSGTYIDELASQLADAGVQPTESDRLAQAGVEIMRERIEATLERFGVHFDHWSSERALVESGALEATLAALKSEGHTYESDGAVWLRTTAMGDDKDRVLVRSDGEPTYFAADIAYHRDKIGRGAEQMIVPLGADHHGYVPRMKAAVGMLSGDPDRYEAPIMQLVNIVEGGERSRMSKRKGDFVSLDELMDDVGPDAARFFLLQRSHDTVIDLDLDLARSESQENPVYYVQYAHARISSILLKAQEEGGVSVGHEGVSDIPAHPSERELIKRVLELPDEVEMAARRRAPHRICTFAQAIAADFHAFYRDCKVVGADDDTGVEGTEAARIAVCLAAQGTIARCLALVGVTAPEQM